MYVTLDVNQLIAVENNYPQAVDIKELLAMHNRKEIILRICAMSASEKQKDGSFLRSFADFEAWVTALGFNRCTYIYPLCYTDISFWDRCLLAGFASTLIEGEIHKILFGNTNILFQHHAHMQQFANDPDDKKNAERIRWRNAKCDVQGFWSHVVAGGGIFVTDDNNFHKASKKPDLLLLSGGDILRPGDAVKFISSGQQLSPPPFDAQAFARTADHSVDKNAIPKEFKHYWSWCNATQQSLPNSPTSTGTAP